MTKFGDLTFGELTFSEMTTVGEMTFGDLTFGEMAFGEMTFGEVTFAEVAFGDLTFGEPTGHRVFKRSFHTFFKARLQETHKTSIALQDKSHNSEPYKLLEYEYSNCNLTTASNFP